MRVVYDTTTGPDHDTTFAITAQGMRNGILPPEAERNISEPVRSILGQLSSPWGRELHLDTTNGGCADILAQ